MAAERQIMGALDARDHDQLTRTLRLLLAQSASEEAASDGQLN
jgi:hypothetical protein